MMSVATIPLSLYIHLPWCALKCPYCDFNSHEGFSPELQQPYVDALLADLSSQTNELSDRTIGSIFTLIMTENTIAAELVSAS